MPVVLTLDAVFCDVLLPELRCKLCDVPRDELRDELLLELRDKFLSELRDELLSDLRDELLSELRDELLSELRDERGLLPPELPLTLVAIIYPLIKILKDANCSIRQLHRE